MIELKTAILASIGLIVYYSIFQIFSDFIRSGMATDTPNKEVESFRTEFEVTIRSFQKNNNLFGFAWFKSIWVNENLFKRKKKLRFTLHHEYYHLKHKHKQKTVLMRFLFALVPMLLVVLSWYYFIPITLALSYGLYWANCKFEDKANAYAKKMTGIDEKKVFGHNN